ncbi:restriction endonuclease subunit S [Brevundimonas sp. BAL450]|uniref:restriction endonuclease subunit S n=1 Tax=Brevundimonas TaxID=41275 RepID=UPI0009DE57B1|nr:MULTISPECIES: restriction endonuclease subunit S [Brevundimonas]MBG7615589.1 restriction endonuclease subunit S [Brevundimonas sp. BAL450]
MHSWPSVTIGEVAKVFDGPHATPETVDTGPIFLGISALQEGRIVLSETRHVTPEVFEKWTRRVKPEPGDVVFSYETRLGQAALIPDGLNCCLGRRMGLVRADRSRLDPRFFLYTYLSPAFQELLRSRTIPGATVDRLALKDFPSFPLPLPSLEEQKAISGLLGAIDNKIEANSRTNGTISQLAQSLFDEWAKANLVGGSRALIADLEGRSMVEIGDGFRAQSRDFGPDGLPFLRAAQLNGGFDVGSAEMLGAEAVRKAGRKRSMAGDVAFTSKGTVGRFARVESTTPSFIYSPQVCFWRSLDHVAVHPLILFHWMCSRDLLVQIDLVSGQTDMAPYVSLKDQRRMSMPVFPASQHELASVLSPMRELHTSLREQSRTLAALRDLLLPKLMSGAIRVKDAEAMLEEVA